MDLPADLYDSLDAANLAAVLGWWKALTPQQQSELSENSNENRLEFESLKEEIEPDDPRRPIYDYLINHELRVVGYVDESQIKGSYRIMSAYLASLGSDFRHGQSGTVQ